LDTIAHLSLTPDSFLGSYEIIGTLGIGAPPADERLGLVILFKSHL